MADIDKYNAVFTGVFKVDADQLTAEFTADKVVEWDSITHLSLVTGIEDAFDVMLDPPDILGFRSYEEGKAILAKYNVQL